MEDKKKPLVPKTHEKKISEISRSKLLFDRWRFFRILAAAIGSLSIFPGALDYEYRYKPDRNFNVCSQNEDYSMTPRILMLVFSWTAILLLIPYRITYLKWRVHVPRTYIELPSQKKIPLHQVIKNRTKPKWTEYFAGDTIPSIILYLILPYPGLEYTLYTGQERKFQSEYVCYYLAEILYAVSYLRVIVLALALFYFGKYSNQVSLRQCEKFSVTPGIGFSFKCYLNEKPMMMVVFFLLIPCVFIFGILLHVFERPIGPGNDTSKLNSDYDYFGNCIWNVFITMSTVGYGDLYPATLGGRITLALSAFAGGIVLSMTFVAIGSYLNLTTEENSALEEVDLSFAAAEAICAAYKFSLIPKKCYWDFVKLREKINAFKDLRLQGSDEGSGVTPELLEKRIQDLNDKIGELKSSIGSLSNKMSKLKS
jgi:Ion transport protein